MKARLGVFGLVLLAGCGTGGAEPGDRDAVRPNAHAGPFRPLRDNELAPTSGPAPYPLKNPARQFREPSALALTESGEPGRLALYAVAQIAGVTGIYRFLAPDARSLDPNPDPPEPVLRSKLGWEGDSVGSPSAHRVGEEVWLFYAAAAGIGLARSADGVEFVRASSPVLAIDTRVRWEAGLAPGDPSFLKLGSDDFRLYYSVNGRIGEARSRDGIHYERAGNTPLLEPRAGSGGSSVYDDAAVEAPHALLAHSPEGRRITRIYYAAVDSEGTGSVGLAARFGTDGPLERAAIPVFVTARHPRSPWVLTFDDFALLFVSQQAGATAALDYPAIAIGVSPPSVSLSVR